MYQLFISNQLVFKSNSWAKYYEMYNALNQSSWYLELHRFHV